MKLTKLRKSLLTPAIAVLSSTLAYADLPDLPYETDELYT
jgi:hypothetical protein